MSRSLPIRKIAPPHTQQGAVLFVALVFLVLITLLGLTASSTSVLQERMTGGLRNNQLALMGAETALRSVEWSLWNASNTYTPFCGATGGNSYCYQPTTANPAGVALMNPIVATFRNAKAWLGNADGGNAYTTATLTGLSGPEATASLANQPRYLVEDLGVVAPGQSGQGGDRDNVLCRGPLCQNIHTFRITARSTGGNPGSVRVVESYFIALLPSL
jgi:type IV pilus assembly protein PilX